MGWYGINQNFRNVQEYAEQELKIDAEKGIILDRAYYGNTVYSLIESKTDGSRMILVDLVRHESDGYWLHKPLSENCGPSDYDCPERILKLSTSTNSYAIEWREKCRQKRRNKSETIKIFKKLIPDMVITTDRGEKLKFMHPYNKTCTQIVCSQVSDGKVYRFSYTSFKPEQLKQDLIGSVAA